MMPTKAEVMIALKRRMFLCKSCSARKESSCVVGPEGDVNSKIFFLGRNPGRVEQIERRPFVGPGGKLLGSVIAALGLRRQNVFISNIVKCGTTSDREPTDEEIKICFKWLSRELKIVRPRLIVTLGNQANRVIMGVKSKSVTQIHGRLVIHNVLKCYVFPMMHPGYILRNPAAREIIFNQDVPKLKRFIEREKLK